MKKIITFLFVLALITSCNKDGSGPIVKDVLDFNVVTGAPFAGVQNGSVGVADVDNDGDLDVLITGESHGQQPISKLYKNSGSGFYELVLNTTFEGVERSSVDFADIDNDGDQDVLITGVNENSIVVSKLYKNDGSGDFDEVFGTPFRPVYESSVAFEDIDSDGDQDLLITGWSGAPVTRLYTNDGTGVFDEVFSIPFINVRASSIAFSDVDGDNDQDVLITGLQGSAQANSKLYTNDGTGTFTEVSNTPFQGVYYGSVAFADIDGDNDQDVLITGLINGSGLDLVKVIKLYKNDGTGNFTEVTDNTFEAIYRGSIAFADVDNDGDQDVLITGSPNDNSVVLLTKLYRNDGSGAFTEELDVSLNPVTGSSVVFLDVDNDADQDILITGFSSGGPASKLFIND